MVHPSVRPPVFPSFRPVVFGRRPFPASDVSLSNGLSRCGAPMGKGRLVAPRRDGGGGGAGGRGGGGGGGGLCATTAAAATTRSFFFERKCPNNEVGRKEISPAASLRLPPFPLMHCTHYSAVSH